MKKTLSTLALLMLGTTLIAIAQSRVKSQAEPFENFDLLKGNVKALTESVFCIRNGENKNGAVFGGRYTRMFDTKGRMVNEIFQTEDGSDMEKMTFLYDGEGDRVGIKSVNGSFDGVSKVFKSSDGAKIIETTYSSGISVNKYNIQGQTYERLFYKDPKNIQKKMTYLYDKNGNLITWDQFSGKDSTLTRWAFDYDTTNTLLKVEINVAGVILAIKTFKYDENGFKQEEATYKPKSKISVVDKYSYANFDKAGNWLEKTSFRNGKMTEISERKIQYY